MRVLCLASLLLLAGCSRSEPTLRMVNITSLGAFPFRFAQELGHFRDEGLRVELEEMASGAKAVQAVLGGSADVVTLGVANAVIVATSGGQLKAFHNLIDGEGVLLIVSPANAGRIRAVADLKGSTVGVGAVGAWQDRLLTFYLKRAGLSPADVRVTGVGLGPLAVAALEHNKVDAVLVGGLEFASVKLRAPGVRILVDPRSRERQREIFGVDALPGSLGFAATGKWLAQHPDQARRLTRAINRTVRRIREQPPEQILSRLPLQLREEDKALHLEQLKIFIGMLSKDGRMPPGGPEAVQRVLAASLESVKAVDLTSTWTNEFVED